MFVEIFQAQEQSQKVDEEMDKLTEIETVENQG